jgi:hypothetical protein
MPDSIQQQQQQQPPAATAEGCLAGMLE